jgi:Phosphoesterase family
MMLQVGATGTGAARQVTNQGFVDSYERKGRGLAAPAFEGLLGPLIGSIFGPKAGAGIQGRGPLIMRSQTPEQVPVLSTLAQQFAVCCRWFCSVPGETWPNRNFVHAATSDGCGATLPLPGPVSVSDSASSCRGGISTPLWASSSPASPSRSARRSGSHCSNGWSASVVAPARHPADPARHPQSIWNRARALSPRNLWRSASGNAAANSSRSPMY